ncbi:MAG TPA: peptidoglycan recognition family protein [Thermoanaerobaculia bacterium]|nr:peptidoglycan recognition family protein [Thermoanaerobaculia bacterium]
MAQLQIVSKQGEFFREYAVESGDTVPEISFRFGQADWQSVYDHSVNAAFRAQFPDPLQLAAGSSVSLFVPLVGKSGSGVSIQGAPLSAFLSAHVVDRFGSPLANVTVRLIEPGRPLSLSRAVTTNLNGDIFIPNPKAGAHALVSPDYQLVAPQSVAAVPLIVDASGLYLRDSDPTTHFSLTPNVVNQVAAVRVFYIVCPMCAATFRIKSGPAAGAITCLNDDRFDLTKIEEAVRTDPDSFMSAKSIAGQIPKTEVNALKCRGYTESVSLFGPVPIFWEESRFADPQGGNYRLRAVRRDGTVLLVAVDGRKSWGSVGPIIGPGRNYLFHATPKPASKPYAGLAIPNNQTNRLSSVLKWITVHHTGTEGEAKNGGVATVKGVQHAHQTSGIQDSPAADIGYHFFIDSDGTLHEARPLGISGSQVPDFNAGNVGIVLAGHFGEIKNKKREGTDVPTPDAIKTLDDLIEVLSLRFGIRSVWTHNERKQQAEKGGTACPGIELTPHVAEILRKQYPGPPK